jgi:hypothetical protein
MVEFQEIFRLPGPDPARIRPVIITVAKINSGINVFFMA